MGFEPHSLESRLKPRVEANVNGLWDHGDSNFDVANILGSVAEPSWTSPLYLPHAQGGFDVEHMSF